MIRLYVRADLSEGARVQIEAKQAHYLVNVMRQPPGAAVELFNGRDGAWRARLVEASKRGAALSVEARTRDQQATPDLELVVALVKRGRLETIVEKAAELGCRRVRLVTTRRTNAERANVARLQAIATEAAEQCERLDVTEIVGPEKLERVLDGWEAGRRLLYCDEAAAGGAWDASPGGERPVAPALEALRDQPRGAWAVLVGPEGGFDPAEQARLRALPFVVPVGLGPRILRADTAAIAALTLWQAALGDWTASSAAKGPGA